MPKCLKIWYRCADVSSCFVGRVFKMLQVHTFFIEMANHLEGHEGKSKIISKIENVG